MSTVVYRAASSKNVKQYVTDFTLALTNKGFTVHNASKMEMKEIFCDHGQVVPDTFDLHMVQICKPEKAAKTLMTNIERSVLLPKFVMVFTKDGTTQIRMLRYGVELVSELINDEEFGHSMQQTFDALASSIEEAS